MAILAHLLSSKSWLSFPKSRARSHKPPVGHKITPSKETDEEKKGQSESKFEMFARRRLRKEFTTMMGDNDVSHCSYGPVDDDPFHLQAIIIGPSDTPFEGGIFFLTIHVPLEYPFKPPLVKFQTKVFHPNVGSDGTIQIDILSAAGWTPALTLQTLLLSICSFLPDPNHDPDACNPVCQLYWNDRKRYDEIAREWTSKYAML